MHFMKAILNLPSTPNLKLIVITITFPWAAKIDPSYGFPLFHSNDSPCIYAIAANALLFFADVSTTMKWILIFQKFCLGLKRVY